MSKRHKIPPINLSDFKDKLEVEGKIPVIVGDLTFYIKPPTLLTDDEYRTLRSLDDDDLISQARLMVDDYDGFVAAGGSAMIVNQIVAEAALTQTSEQGVGPGESGASSTS
jgi:hypothetical protein